MQIKQLKAYDKAQQKPLYIALLAKIILKSPLLSYNKWSNTLQLMLESSTSLLFTQYDLRKKLGILVLIEKLYPEPLSLTECYWIKY